MDLAIAALILGALYGLMIELFTSVVFGARQVGFAEASGVSG